MTFFVTDCVYLYRLLNWDKGIVLLWQDLAKEALSKYHCCAETWDRTSDL